MTDPLQPTILDTLAAHVRRCAVLTDDADAVDTLMHCARELDDRAEEIRTHQRYADRVRPPPEAPTNH